MKIRFWGIDKLFDSDSGKIHTIVIENAKFLYEVLKDIQSRIDGNDGVSVVSEDNKQIDFAKSVELITSFVTFDINRKNLLNKVNTLLEKRVLEPDLFMQTTEVMGALEQLLVNATMDFTGNIEFSKLNISSILKAAGLEFDSEYDSLSEMLIDYFELVKEYDRDKIFVLYNLRSIIDDQEASLFFDSCLRRNLNVICIESCMHLKQCNEEVYIIDKELCEISD